MSFAGDMPESILGDSTILNPISFKLLLRTFDELRQILYDLDLASLRSGLSSMFSRSKTMSGKALVFDEILVHSYNKLVPCYVGCHAHLEDQSANDLKMKVLEHLKFAGNLEKAHHAIDESLNRLLEIRKALKAHILFNKQPTEAEYGTYSNIIQDDVLMLLDMVKAMNILYLKVLNEVSGHQYMEMPNFELRREALPVEDDEYLAQIDREVSLWNRGVLMTLQDPIVRDD